MKIIDNKKDYYDYLQGIYGIDPLIVFDRRGSHIVSKESYWRDYPLLFSGDKNLEYYFWIGKKFYFIHWNETMCCWAWTYDYELLKQTRYRYTIPTKKTNDIVEVCVVDRHSRNRFNVEVIREGNPILKEFKILQKFVPAEQVWDAIYNHISSQKDKPIVDTRTDIQKVESYGFDKKTSFRNM